MLRWDWLGRNIDVVLADLGSTSRSRSRRLRSAP